MSYKIVLSVKDYDFLICQIEGLVEAGGEIETIKNLVRILKIFEEYTENL